MARQQDLKLIVDYQKGESKAHSRIHGWISAVVRNSDWGFQSDVEDIIQDVKMKLLENFQDGKFGFRSSVKTYIWRVTKYTCIDYLRCRKSLPSFDTSLPEIADPHANPEKEVYEKEQKEIFMAIFKGLPEYCRHLWRMVWHQKLPYARIAQILDISEGTVKSRFARCKEKAIELGRKLSGNSPGLDSTI
jgi:RNA polymerase sigma factor (sigma-70 family)